MNLTKVNLLFIFIVTLIKFNTLLDSPRQKQKQQTMHWYASLTVAHLNIKKFLASTALFVAREVEIVEIPKSEIPQHYPL